MTFDAIMLALAVLAFWEMQAAARREFHARVAMRRIKDGCK